MDHFDICVIGAGVIGLAIARSLSRNSQTKTGQILLLEQEDSFGQHSSSRNSEVIHAGIYYPENSLKAQLCVQGKLLLYDYCREHNIPHKRIGKLILAQHDERAVLENLFTHAAGNGVNDLEWMNRSQLQVLEPEARAEYALFSPSSGIIDSHTYMASLLQQAESRGVVYSPRSKVLDISRHANGFRLATEHTSGATTERFQLTCTTLINSSGLWAQDVASRIEGLPPSTIPASYPCKGWYYSYAAKSPFQHLVYPVPEAAVKSLGIHGTLDMNGQLRFGPNAEYVDKLDYSFNPDYRRVFAKSIVRYFPGLQEEKLVPGYTGIRPKISGPGQPFADFLIQDHQIHKIPGLIQLFGIESPGLTASLAIAEHVNSLLR